MGIFHDNLGAWRLINLCFFTHENIEQHGPGGLISGLLALSVRGVSLGRVSVSVVLDHLSA